MPHMICSRCEDSEDTEPHLLFGVFRIRLCGECQPIVEHKETTGEIFL